MHYMTSVCVSSSHAQLRKVCPSYLPLQFSAVLWRTGYLLKVWHFMSSSGSQAQPDDEFLCGLVCGYCGSRPTVRSMCQHVPCGTMLKLPAFAANCFETLLWDRNPNMCHSAISSTLVNNYTVYCLVYCSKGRNPHSAVRRKTTQAEKWIL